MATESGSLFLTYCLCTLNDFPVGVVMVQGKVLPCVLLGSWNMEWRAEP